MVKPALTAEEWVGTKCFDNRTTGSGRGFIEFGTIKLLEYANDGGVWNGLHIYRKGSLLCNVNAPNLNALAAFCLHGQPFGFTWEDVDDSRQAAYVARTSYRGVEAARYDSLADRIEALLPPKEPDDV